MADVRCFHGIRLGLDLEHEVDHVPEGQVGGVRRMPASPTGVVADPVFRNIAQGIVGRCDAHLHMLPIGFDTHGGIGHAKPGDQRRIIDLEDKPRFNHGFVVALAEVSQGIEIRLFRLVILVPEEVGYPPWAEQRKEKIIYVCRDHSILTGFWYGSRGAFVV